jgi:GTPase SAR1 family protein
MRTGSVVSSFFDVFWGLMISLAALAGAVVGGAVLVKYAQIAFAVLARGAGDADVVIGPEPAFKQYFFRRAWTDYRSVVTKSIETCREMYESILKASHFAGRGCWVAANAIIVGSVGGTLAGGMVLVVVGILHLAVVSAVAAVAMVLAYLSRFLEYSSMLWRRSFMACPHSGCYRRIALPIYICSHCGTQHKQLIPGSYGTFRRRCKCNRELPTLFLLGRNKLRSLCPHCKRPLNEAIGLPRNLHIPIVGGASAGKSSLLTGIMVELALRAQKNQLKLEFPEKKDERLFQASQKSFANGQLLSKTVEYSPNAFLATIEDTRGKRVLVYTYDAAGELYQGVEEIHRQEYYSYLHGIILIIDPFSIPEVRQRGGAEFYRRQHSLRPSSESPEAVYERMIDTLRGFSEKTGRLDLPLAVVLTKVDALGLRETLQADGAQPQEEISSAAVKHWLKQHGEGGLVRVIEKDFKDVHYFACSALGRMPGTEPAAFVPQGVLQPFAWILGHYGPRIAAKPEAA